MGVTNKINKKSSSATQIVSTIAVALNLSIFAIVGLIIDETETVIAVIIIVVRTWSF